MLFSKQLLIERLLDNQLLLDDQLLGVSLTMAWARCTLAPELWVLVGLT